MKKLMICLCVCLLLAACAQAETVAEYPLLTNEIRTVEPTAQLSAEINAILTHVQQEPVAYYFPAGVQAQIDAVKPKHATLPTLWLYEMDPVKADGTPLQTQAVYATPYDDGTEFVAVLGLPAPDGMSWRAWHCVAQDGRVALTFEEHEAAAMAQEPVLLLLIGEPPPAEGYVSRLHPEESGATPSKTGGDMTFIQTQDGGYGFRIFETDPSFIVNEQLYHMAAHVREHRIVTYFPEAAVEAVAQIFPEAERLLAYELVPVECEGYARIYGDARAIFRFATPYHEGQELAVLLGMPKAYVTPADTDLMTWSVQRCTVENGKVNVFFHEEELVVMEEKVALLTVLSMPLEPQE